MPAKKSPRSTGKVGKPEPVPDVIPRIRTLAGFLCEFLNQHQQRPDRPFCFILGAGASKESNIPTGQEMAAKWLNEIHQHENIENLSLRKWATAERMGIAGFDADQPALHYSKLYARRYMGNEDGGYAFLESVMEKSEPSFGYSVLAYILGETPHKIVITTNFDNLVADALAVHADKFPLVVTDDALVRYIRSKVRRPLIAKVHGSLGFTPKSKEDELTLSGDWSKALEEVFRNYTPIVIGYDGNDGSLMSLLESLPYGVPDRFWWCYYSPSGDHGADATALPARIRRLVAEHNGFLVPIAGFDHLMAELLLHIRGELKIPDLHDRLREKSESRLAAYDSQWQKLCGDGRTSGEVESEPLQQPTIQSTKPDAAKTSEDEPMQDIMRRLAKARNAKPWWQWQKEIDAAVSNAEKDDLYRKAIEANPKNAPLLGNYANFLRTVRKDHDAAEILYKRAIESDPTRLINLSNYASFLTDIRKDHNDAETLYKRAIEADPTYASALVNYAHFLNTVRKDYDAAETLYKRAIEADPTRVSALGNYATFLMGIRKDHDAAETFYKRAIEADLTNATALGNYATFLKTIRKDYDTAETLYKRSIEADPTNAAALSNYANFLMGIRKDHDAAETLYKRAIEADPTNATALGNYASFLMGIRKDHDAAEPLYKRAIEIDPTKAVTLGNYGQQLVAVGRVSDGLDYLRRAWENDNSEDAMFCAELSLSLWLGSYLAGTEAKVWERVFKQALTIGFDRPVWTFDGILERAKEKLRREEFDYATALTAAFLEESKVPQLDAFPRWRDLEPLDPARVEPDGSVRAA